MVFWLYSMSYCCVCYGNNLKIRFKYWISWNKKDRENFIFFKIVVNVV